MIVLSNNPSPNKYGMNTSMSSIQNFRIDQLQEEVDDKNFVVKQLKKTLEIVAHMVSFMVILNLNEKLLIVFLVVNLYILKAFQAGELVTEERKKHKNKLRNLENKLQKYEMEIAKKYAIIK